MSRIIFRDTYIIIVPSFPTVEIHSHPILHLFVSSKKCNLKILNRPVCGDAIFLAANTEHTLEEDNNCEIFFLFDLTSDYAKQIREHYLKDQPYCILTDSLSLSCPNTIDTMTDDEIIEYSEALILTLLHIPKKQAIQDDRINTLLAGIRQGIYYNSSIADIANTLYLSESRLLHLFKETMNISLKSYILMRRLEFAYQQVLDGKNITFAAMEAGFSSAAHLAYTCKKYTGISITNVLKR